MPTLDPPVWTQLADLVADVVRRGRHEDPHDVAGAVLDEIVAHLADIGVPGEVLVTLSPTVLPPPS